MKDISIESPCNENWNKMTATEKGAFCQKCSSEVHDFTNKSNDEIRSILRDNIGSKICGRYTNTQHASLNADFEAWQYKSQRTVQRAMLFSLIVVFGLTLFSCNSPKEEQALAQAQITLAEMTAVNHVKEKAMQEQQKQLLHDVKLAEPQIKLLQKVEFVQLERIQQEVFLKDEETYSVTVTADQVDKTDIFYHIMGMPSFSSRYDEYLLQQEVRPTEPEVIELDANGIEFPTYFGSKVFPNPAAESTSLEIKSPVKQDHVVIALYDMTGSFIQSIHDGEMDRGTQTYQLSLIDLQPGIYLVVINSNGYKETVRISKT